MVPLSKGGKWVWENLVTACTKCNGKKGSKSLKQLGWNLKQRPKEPSPYQLGILLGIETELSKPPKVSHLALNTSEHDLQPYIFLMASKLSYQAWCCWKEKCYVN